MSILKFSLQFKLVGQVLAMWWTSIQECGKTWTNLDGSNTDNTRAISRINIVPVECLNMREGWFNA